MSLSAFINPLYFHLSLSDWSLRSADMGEISGAKRNKGQLVCRFLCSCFSCFSFSAFFVLKTLLPLLFYPLTFTSPSLFKSCVALASSYFPVFFLFNSLLSGLWGAHLHISPLILLRPSFPPPPPLQFISLVSTKQGGRSSCFPQCTSAHPVDT